MQPGHYGHVKKRNEHADPHQLCIRSDEHGRKMQVLFTPYTGKGRTVSNDKAKERERKREKGKGIVNADRPAHIPEACATRGTKRRDLPEACQAVHISHQSCEDARRSSIVGNGSYGTLSRVVPSRVKRLRGERGTLQADIVQMASRILTRPSIREKPGYIHPTRTRPHSRTWPCCGMTEWTEDRKGQEY